MSCIASSCWSWVSCSCPPGGARAASPAEVARGKYIFGAAAGCGCHTEPKGPPKDLTPADLRAIARYLKSVPAVGNKVD